MAKTVTIASYRNRILTVVDYIWKNLDKEVDVNTLADVAHFSPYHFHRIYREMMHETVNATVRRLRLHLAACLLARNNDSIDSIARQLNYGSSEAFSRAFAKVYDLSPAQYRVSRRQWDPAQQQLPNQRTYPMSYNVEVKAIDSISLGGLPHQGDYLAIGPVFEQVFVKAGTAGLIGPNTRSIGIYYDDPFELTDLERAKLHSHACVTAEKDQAKEAGMEALTVGGGEHAILQFTGPYADLEKAYTWFYGEWLPNSGFEAADAPPFEEYLNDPKETPPSDLQTLIYLPLAN